MIHEHPADVTYEMHGLLKWGFHYRGGGRSDHWVEVFSSLPIRNAGDILRGVGVGELRHVCSPTLEPSSNPA